MQARVRERNDGARPKDRELLTLAEWLEEKRREEHLSLRKAAKRTGLSQSTIANVLKGERPSVETIDKLVEAFSGDGQYERAALKDWLLEICGYRNNNEKGEIRQPLARLIDKLSSLNDEELKIMEQFAEFITKSGFKA